MSERSPYTFFFTEASPFSQWYPCSFTMPVDGPVFTCAEQYMMYGKAMLFGDHAVAAKVLAAAHPREHKALGRAVAPYDEHAWRVHRERIVMDGNRAKFTQDAALRAALIATAGTLLVEASPYDKIWGIGLAATDPRALDPAQWRGQNLLGKVLTSLRDELSA
ncbi:MAG: NADAR family protein [Proteobacteria bacterium]|nr:NADAR family protein [Pseudomonadota bacterium]